MELSCEIRQRKPAILEVVERCGLILHGQGEKRWLRCPLQGHNDHRASAVIFLNTQRFHCAVCTPGASLTARQLAQALGGGVYGRENPSVSSSVSHRHQEREPNAETLSTQDLIDVWKQALHRATRAAPERDTTDLDAHRYLESRLLDAACGHRALGILAPSLSLPVPIQRWTRAGYRIVMALYSMRTGEIQSLQARSIRPHATPKTLLLRNIPVQGAVFTNERGLALIRGETDASTVILAEGLTDHLALTIHTDAAVFSAPGASAAVSLMNSWIKGRRLVVALDRDAAGDAAAAEVMRRAFLLRTSSVQRLTWPEPSKDACDALKQLGPERFSEFVSHALKEHKP